MNYSIDSDILIYSIKGAEAVNERFAEKRNQLKSISVVTYGEIFLGARKSTRAAKNSTRVRRIAELFPIINISRAIMETYGEYKALLSKSGKLIDDTDLLIAASAITHNLILVTNNENNFSRIEELEIENWST